MKNTAKIALLVITAFVACSSVSYAATSVSTPTINVSAQVSSNLTIQALLYKNSVASANAIPGNNTMNFGTLQNVGTGSLRSSTTGSTGTGSVVALVSAVSSGTPYTITQTGTALSSGTNTLPSGACTVVPTYSTADNGGAALVGTLGTSGTWVGTKTLYTSDAAADTRAFQASYSITDDPAAGATTGVPLNQAAGTYTGTVTFTVTA